MKVLQMILNPIAAMTPRQLALFVTFLAWCCLQVFTVNHLWHEKSIEYVEQFNLNVSCTRINKEMPNAYVTMKPKCDAARAIIATLPFVSALQQTVNTTWPHPYNIKKWTSEWVASLLSEVSFVSYIIGGLGVWFTWPQIGSKVFVVKDVVNKVKEAKGQIELAKLIITHGLPSTAATAPGRRGAGKIESVCSPHVTEVTEESN